MNNIIQLYINKYTYYTLKIVKFKKITYYTYIGLVILKSFIRYIECVEPQMGYNSYAYQYIK